MSTQNQGDQNRVDWPESKPGRLKNFFKENQAEIVSVLAVIFTGLTCFALGYLVAQKEIKNDLVFQAALTAPAAGDRQAAASGGSVVNEASGQTQASALTQEKIRFTASKSGEKYHWPWCSFAERIKEENRIYFNSEQEAQAAGYSRCGNFEKEAPMGYK